MDKRRDLNITPSAGQPGFLSPASGVVKLGNRVFVVSADTLTLAEFSLADLNAPGSLHELMANNATLPANGSCAFTPEFESLIHLSPEDIPPSGALLAVPSGKSKDKCTGVLLLLDETGAVDTQKLVDFSSLYASLSLQISELNIEGAVCGTEKVFFFQRGNNNGSRNSIIEVHKDRFIDCLRYFASVESISLSAVSDCELDQIGGFRLGFTDAATLLDGRLVFTAAAEDEGSCKGFAIGLMSRELQILKLKKFDRGPQIEGIFAESAEPPLLWMVFDKVAPETPSALYTMVLE